MTILTLDTGNDGREYNAFLAEKVAYDRAYGFSVHDDDITETLLPHQRELVKWGVAGGRRAYFARFGLGKTALQIETLRLIIEHPASPVCGGRALIVAPLGVRAEFIADGKRLFDREIRFIRRTSEVDPEWSGIYVTNYESVRDKKLDVNQFQAASLDEAAVLRSYGSKTYQEFLGLFADLPFRYVATATPSPNRHKELIHYAGFLGVMDTGQALNRFFKRDSSKAGNLQIHPHKVNEFRMWLASWSVWVQKPSDLGFSDAGYDLPPLSMKWHEVKTSILSDQVERDGQGVLVRGGNLSMVDAAREKQRTLPERVETLMGIIREHRAACDDGDGIILWCDLNAEQAAIEKALAAEGITFSSVYGALSDDEADTRVETWKRGDTYALIGKPVMLGAGRNFQRANTAVFVGVTHKFYNTIQACHRIQRYGQTRACTVHLIYAETESSVRDTLADKWAEHETLTDGMSDIIRKYRLDASKVTKDLVRAIGVDREEHHGDGWTIVLEDAIREWASVKESSFGTIITSIPFGDQYEYSSNYCDFGHVDGNGQFWWQMDYLTPNLYRALMPGRILAVHVKDKQLFGSVTGAGVYTVSTFHAEAIAHYLSHGFDYYGMITVTTDVVRENNQSYRLSYSKMLKDHTPMGVGSPEYVLLFHKPQTDRTVGWADVRVVKDKTDYSVGQWQIDAAADWRTGGNRLLSRDELAALDTGARMKLFTAQSVNNVYDYDEHVALADQLAARNALPGTFASLVPGSPRPDVWTDVLRIDNLNSSQTRRDVENHLCPFPLDIPRRLITMYSNPGELVGDPFSGLGSTVLEAVKQGRRGFGTELNPVSVADSLVYLRQYDNEKNTPTLFDLLDIEGAA